jgi:ABC-2 type transport system permease protein
MNTITRDRAQVPQTSAAVRPAPVARQVGLLVQWQFRRMSSFLPMLVVVQILLAVTTVLGYGLLVGTPPPEQALYLATGASTVTLVMVGLVMTPQLVAQARTEGSLDWMRTLPVPRTVFLGADLALWTLIALPGMVLGVVAGALKFDVHLSLSPWLPLAAVAVSLTSACVGYAIACLLPPQVAQLASQVLVFVVLLFSPVSFPASRLPGWLATAHHWLPIEPMADAIRATLVRDSFAMPARSTAVLGVWLAASVAGAAWALRRRA